MYDAHNSRLHPLTADCAVCAEGFAPAANNRCRKCSEETKGRTTGLATTFIVVVLCLTLLVASYLLQTEDSGNVERCSWRRKFSAFHNALVKSAPLSAVSIVVVVLQIVIQVGAVGECTCTLGNHSQVCLGSSTNPRSSLAQICSTLMKSKMWWYCNIIDHCGILI